MSAKSILPVAAAALAALSVCACSSFTPAPAPDPHAAQNMRKTCQFIKDAGTYFIATADKDQPRVRPFGTIHIFEGKLYIQTGKRKDVSKQFAANPKVELCALKDGQWIRLSGTLVNDDRIAAKESMLNAFPALKEMYRPDDANTQVLYFKDARAVIYSFDRAPEVMTF